MNILSILTANLDGVDGVCGGSMVTESSSRPILDTTGTLPLRSPKPPDTSPLDFS